jgi:pseudaminic acid cytidylyltransferase
MNNVAIIPARGGSKRIPRKNIKLFRGKPIIAYSVETAIQSGLFDEVIVSTDDAEIADMSRKLGAEVPFMRSVATSDDFSTTADVLIEVLSELNKRGKQFEYGCCIYPTAPFVTAQLLREGLTLLDDKRFTTVFPIVPFSYPIYRGLTMSTSAEVKMIWPENLNKRSQDLPVAYHDAGQFYWIRINEFLTEKKLFTPNSGAILSNELLVQDIDNESDWLLAELKFSLFKGNA